MPHPREGPLIVLYDGDCGFCKAVLAVLLTWDRGKRLRPAAIQSARGNELLRDMERQERLDSWHLVDPGGEVRSGGAGIPVVFGALSGGAPMAAIASRSPQTTSRAYEWVASHRVPLGRLLGDRSRAWAARVIAARGSSDDAARGSADDPGSS
jgi:predicted DCC family thiol-disulfide oxidoreductase YuxK